MPLTEKALQTEIIRILNDEDILEILRDTELIDNALHMDTNAHMLPGYQIDFQLRTKYARGAKAVLDSLETIEIISGEIIKNISLQVDTDAKRERLYPDVILANPERSTFTLIELKKDSQTEREAITELLAYAIELKNHLPNIADSDINLMVISTEYNSLLDHAVSSIVLGSKFNILAVKASHDNNGFAFKVHLMDSWTDIWQNLLPEYAFSSVSLVPYNYRKLEDIPGTVWLFDVINDLLMFEGAKHNSHGFYIIWDNVTEFDSPAKFCISIYQVNPFVFLQASIDKSFTLNSGEPLSQYILREFNDNGPHNQPESLMKTAETVKQFLDKFFDTDYEDFSSWTDHMYPGSNFRSQANPIYFNSWGNIGEYLRYFFFHPSQKSGYISKQQLTSPLYYRDPVYGIEMINRISGLTLFEDGVFNCTALYRYATQLREHLQIADMFYRSKVEKKKYRLLKPRLFFSAIDLLSAQREIQYRANSIKQKPEEVAPLKIYIHDVSEDPVSNATNYIDSFVKSFLKDNPFHQIFFGEVFNWCILFMPDFSEGLGVEEKLTLQNEIVAFVKFHLKGILIDELVSKNTFYGDDLLPQIECGYFNGKLPEFKQDIDVINSVDSIENDVIIENFSTIFLSILDTVVPEVFHSLIEFSDASFSLKDIDRLKTHLVKRFHEGHRYGAITVQSNGNLAIGVLPEDKQMLAPITDPEAEVFVYLNESGIGIVQRTTWDEVRAGKPFNIRKKE